MQNTTYETATRYRAPVSEMANIGRDKNPVQHNKKVVVHVEMLNSGQMGWHLLQLGNYQIAALFLPQMKAYCVNDCHCFALFSLCYTACTCGFPHTFSLSAIPCKYVEALKYGNSLSLAGFGQCNCDSGCRQKF